MSADAAPPVPAWIRRLTGPVVALAGLMFLGVGLLDNINFTVDDTYISMRYAENIAAGQGPVFNDGERVEGYSNPIWTFGLAAFAGAGWNQERGDFGLLKAAKASGALLAVVTLLLLWWVTTGGRRALGLDAHDLVMPLAVLGVGTTFSFSLWAVSGLETVLAALLVTLGGVLIAAGLKAEDGAPGSGRTLLLLGGTAFGLCMLVRPETLFVWGLAIVIFMVTVPARLRAAILVSAIPAILIAIATWSARLAYYHEWLPNSAVAKSGGGPVAAILGVKYALAGLAGTVGILGIGLLGVPALFRAGPQWRFLIAYCTAHLLFIAASGGDWMPGFRFHVPVLPLMWLVGAAGLAVFLEERSRPRWMGAVFLMIVLCGASFFAGRSLVRAQWVYPTGLKGIKWDPSPTRIAVAKEIRGMLAPGDTLAMFEAGCIPYYNRDLYVMDLSGLMEPGIARLPGRHMYKLTADYFLERAPEYYMTMVKMGSPSGDGVVLLQSPEFRERYELVQYIESRKRGLASAAAGTAPAIEEDVDFALYRRRF